MANKNNQKFKFTGIVETSDIFNQNGGAFSAIGVSHTFETGTLTVTSEDGSVQVFRNVITYKSVPLEETDAEKIVRLTDRVKELEKHADERNESHRKLVNKKNSALKDIIQLSKKDNISFFGKTKRFSDICVIADNAVSNYFD